MGTMKTAKPSWWKDEHTSSWARIKEALRRDWEQTKHDLHMGGKELNQNVTDTVKQATGKEEPAKTGWNEIEEPMGYGYGARMQYGREHPAWSNELEGKLRSEWTTMPSGASRRWDDVRRYVRHGYEYQDRTAGATPPPPDRPSQNTFGRR